MRNLFSLSRVGRRAAALAGGACALACCATLTLIAQTAPPHAGSIVAARPIETRNAAAPLSAAPYELRIKSTTSVPLAPANSTVDQESPADPTSAAAIQWRPAVQRIAPRRGSAVRTAAAVSPLSEGESEQHADPRLPELPQSAVPPASTPRASTAPTQEPAAADVSTPDAESPQPWQLREPVSSRGNPRLVQVPSAKQLQPLPSDDPFMPPAPATDPPSAVPPSIIPKPLPVLPPILPKSPAAQRGPQHLPTVSESYEAVAAEPPRDDNSWLPHIFEAEAYERYTGAGEPLVAGSWRNRPYYLGGFIGGISGDTLIPDEINLGSAFFWGARLGWDYDHYWGVESRLAFSSQGIDFLQSPGTDSFNNELLLWDGSLVYYPWGDSRWRPYVEVGIGLADFDYTDVISDVRRSEAVLQIPWGGGFKYRMNQYWTWRLDVTDNLIFGGQAGLATQNQLSVTAGAELRFGGRRTSYWPWNPSQRWR